MLQLQSGSRGGDVARAQRRLTLAGYALVCDGVFGTVVDAAVRAVQARAGLDADGVVGPDTWDLLLSDAVGELADPVALLDFVAGPPPVTSDFGWRTFTYRGAPYSDFHPGRDFGTPQGAPLLWPADLPPGRVIESVVELGSAGGVGCVAFGDFALWACHLSRSPAALGLEVGAPVAPGARWGSTGGTPGTAGAGVGRGGKPATTGPHLHIELRARDPRGNWRAIHPGRGLVAGLATGAG